ncbi:MAG: hypothetical protein V1834_00805 [Candidatus Micrarchaeota archaeon]
MAADSESFLVTIPIAWSLKDHATENRKFSSVQEFIRELIRRDIELWDKEKAESKASK